MVEALRLEMHQRAHLVPTAIILDGLKLYEVGGNFIVLKLPIDLLVQDVAKATFAGYGDPGKRFSKASTVAFATVAPAPV